MTSSRTYQPERRVHVPSPWWGVLMLLGLIAALVGIVFGGFYLWLMTAPPQVRVPAVTGINVRAAEEILARRGLIGQIVSRRYDEKALAETVLEATPTAGKTVRQGRVIELTVSDGPPTVQMPDVRDMDLQKATEAISEVDLRLARIRRIYDQEVPLGSVMAQKPDPDTRVARRGGVELTVSAGPKPVVNPPEASTEPPQDFGQPKYAVVQVSLPPGERPALVRIEVEDRRGVTVVYSEWHDPGATINEVVTGYGDATARVYVDDKLIEEKRF
jgi:hypothetical protein